MIPENLLFWIAPIAESPIDDPPVMCRRHADLMVVPRGWTLDDRRERFPRLFMPRPAGNVGVPAAPPAVLQNSPQASQTGHLNHVRRRRPRPEHPEQLVIDGTGEIPRPVAIAEPVAPMSIDPVLVPVIEPEPEACFDLDAIAAHVPATLPQAQDDETEAAQEPAWTPDFNVDDTLNGLLKAKSPLLARAFRGTGRRR
jgi:hypothetical protein